MEDGRRSGEASGFVVKNKNSSGCLIVRKKGGGNVVGSSGGRKVFEGKKEKKRARMDFSDSGSSDELLMPPRRSLGSETIRVCNGLNDYKRGIEESGVDRKRNKGGVLRRNEGGFIGRNGEDLSERKRSRLDVFDFNEYEAGDGEMVRRKRFDGGSLEKGMFFGTMMMGRDSIGEEYETGSSRHGIADRRKVLILRGKGVSRHPISYNNYDSDEPIRVQGKNGVLKVMVNKKKKVGGSLRSYDHLEDEENRKGLRIEHTVKKNVLPRPSFYSEPKRVEKFGGFVGTERKPSKSMKSSLLKHHKFSDQGTEDSDTSLKLGRTTMEARHSVKSPSSIKKNKGHEQDSDGMEVKTPSNQVPPVKVREGKVKRSTGTEKQKLRERIRGMLLDAGWTIDYRPRRNRDYLDAVYINPGGTAYWSIIKAYDALLKQLNDDEDEVKPRTDTSSFMPLSDEVLSQLTRKTRKKIEKEMKKKQREDSENEIPKKSSSIKHDEESMNSDSHEEKLSSFIKQSNKSMKGRVNGNSYVSLNAKVLSSVHNLHDNNEEPSSGSIAQGRKSRKLGRCTLLVRNSNQGLNTESDGFVPHTGKLTLLAWLIDSGTVQPSQKVRYMNRRRTKVMLEGWITKDGIHCGCCSKILTVSKFEIHAGSKLRQPFQNIYLDSGNSLLECQIDAWNRQDSIERISFHSVDIDGDDPNDDTCGLCGDGGDLICCDGCPSTFHQSCLDIKMLPPGDWHCPNCTCKFCGVASENIIPGDETACSLLLTCVMCAKHSCVEEMDALSVEADSFCGKKCRELFEQLQRYLGVKHELEAGFSWSLIHRTDSELDESLPGLPQRVECNSKLAVALSVMDECFLPIVDRRSGINLIHNVLYNTGSNFNRLNYSGFYTAILEKGDEIISAASIRFHGTRLAEMPFIGTRHTYRRQGMCRRLFYALEMALCSMKVEKLIIPAISELTKTWTEVFGFTTLDESLKHELKSINMLVFPGIDMLQKQLLGQEKFARNLKTSKGVRKVESDGSKRCVPEVASKSDIGSSSGPELKCSNGGSERDSETDDVATANSDSQCRDNPSNDASMMSKFLGASHGVRSSVSLEDDKGSDIESSVRLDESSLDMKKLPDRDGSNGIQGMTNKTGAESTVLNNTGSCFQGDATTVNTEAHSGALSLSGSLLMNNILDASHELKKPVAPEGMRRASIESHDGLSECDNDNLVGSKQDMPCYVKNVVACERGVVDDAQAGKNQSDGDKDEISTVDTQSKDDFSRLCCKDASHNAEEVEAKAASDLADANNGNACTFIDCRKTGGEIADVVCAQLLPSAEDPLAQSPEYEM
ncbi:hypothetical protein K2173_008762 [Erythroxylum novogranatense]|uniref:PHD-type domain-containing protein n=1 Tax=Erythroxylum novogranatense TaxID=1862640 RepID=A0AAV8S5Z6_9ROSI|nr:hypothetical protein K2173_008762 [Erythroxylum novogranatense]